MKLMLPEAPLPSALNAKPKAKKHDSGKKQTLRLKKFHSPRQKRRIFGRELQNQGRLKPKEKGTPSTQNSTPSVGDDSGLSIVLAERRDPQKVEAYQARIAKFLAVREVSQRAKYGYLKKQKDLNAKMRGILVDWLVDVALKFKSLPLTLFGTINLLDRYLEKTPVKRGRLQLVGIACLMIMSKFEEIYPPSIQDYFQVCDKAYSHEEILDAEADVLSVLQFDIAVTPSIVFYENALGKVELPPKPGCFGRYLLETALLDCHALKFKNREMAAGALFLVNKIFKCGKDWSKDLAGQFEGLKESKVKSAANWLFKILSTVSDMGFSAVKRKFATVENYEVSKYKIERASRKGKKKPKKSA